MAATKVDGSSASPQLAGKLGDLQIFHSSKALRLDGMHIDLGFNNGCDVDAPARGHIVALQLNETPLEIETRQGRRWSPTSIRPRTLQLVPHDSPLTIRHGMSAYWARMVIDPRYFLQRLGAVRELDTNWSIEDPVLLGLFTALIGLVRDAGSAVPLMQRRAARAAADAFLLSLGDRMARTLRSGSNPRLYLAETWIDQHLGERFGIDEIAAAAGLSRSHFAREFKLAHGVTLWSYVMNRRLDRARKRLKEGCAVGTTAVACGFVDQPHFTRLFKRRFGTTPGQARRTTKGGHHHCRSQV